MSAFFRRYADPEIRAEHDRTGFCFDEQVGLWESFCLGPACETQVTSH